MNFLLYTIYLRVKLLFRGPPPPGSTTPNSRIMPQSLECSSPTPTA